jgi:hypothetical protein
VIRWPCFLALLASVDGGWRGRLSIAGEYEMTMRPVGPRSNPAPKGSGKNPRKDELTPISFASKRKAWPLTCFGVFALGILATSAARDDTPPLPGYPTIQSADANGSTLLITGTNFGTASRPSIKLGGVSLTLQGTASATAIVATIPVSFGPGSYPLWVQTFIPNSSDRANPIGLPIATQILAFLRNHVAHGNVPDVA